MAVFPSNLVSTSTLPTNITGTQAQQTVHKDYHNNVNAEVIAIEAELGTNPKGSSATVKARLDKVNPPSPQVYTMTNVTTRRTLDANNYTMDQLADLLGTLIADLKVSGQIG